MHDVLRVNVACPLKIKHVALAFEHCKSSALAAVYECIVNMRVIRDFESHKQRLNLVSFVFPNPIAATLDFDITWILKKYCGWAVFKNRFQKTNFSCMRLEYAVGQSRSFPFYELGAEWITKEKSFNFFCDLVVKFRRLCNLAGVLLYHFPGKKQTNLLFTFLSFSN